jgi:hypothetical protein
MKKIMIILIFTLIPTFLSTQEIDVKTIWNNFNGKTTVLEYYRDGEEAGTTIMPLHFSDSKNIISFELYEIFMFEIDFTKSYFNFIAFDFVNYETIKRGEDYYCTIEYNNRELILKPVSYRGTMFKIYALEDK